MRKMTFWSMTVLLGGLLYGVSIAGNGGTPVSPSLLSKDTETCIDCHRSVTPGIVADWRDSRHAKVTPAKAVTKPPLEKRVSSVAIPDALQHRVVGCYECHGLNSTSHKDSFDHFGFKINAIVSPNDCRTCHAEEAEQYSGSKKAHALANLERNPVFLALMNTITDKKEVNQGRIKSMGSSPNAKNETCYACHGTEVKVLQMKKISTDVGDIHVPDLANMPNHGVGRVNPDGSRGSCSACHPRHSFSIEVARKPYTCAQCHLEPDVPAWNVYHGSKHGNIFLSREKEWNFSSVPWVVGKDFKAPTCAACHNSLVVTEGGDLVRKRNHDFGASLWVRIFGLVYSHAQPKDGRTYMIKNKDGLPLPVTFTGEPASGFLIDRNEQEKRFAGMTKTCGACHASTWTARYFEKFHATVADADRMVLSSTQLLLTAWGKGMANKSSPFDEEIEHLWLKQWLFHGNALRYGSAMGGPDYATFKSGWWELNKTLEEMRHSIENKKKGK